MWGRSILPAREEAQLRFQELDRAPAQNLVTGAGGRRDGHSGWGPHAPYFRPLACDVPRSSMRRSAETTVLSLVSTICSRKSGPKVLLHPGMEQEQAKGEGAMDQGTAKTTGRP